LIWLAGDVTDSICSGLDACCDILIHHSIRRTSLGKVVKSVSHPIPLRTNHE
jgi:hypothetical protein